MRFTLAIRHRLSTAGGFGLRVFGVNELLI